MQKYVLDVKFSLEHDPGIKKNLKNRETPENLKNLKYCKIAVAIKMPPTFCPILTNFICFRKFFLNLTAFVQKAPASKSQYILIFEFIDEATKHKKGQNLPFLRRGMDFDSANCIRLGRASEKFMT